MGGSSGTSGSAPQIASPLAYVLVAIAAIMVCLVGAACALIWSEGVELARADAWVLIGATFVFLAMMAVLRLIVSASAKPATPTCALLMLLCATGMWFAIAVLGLAGLLAGLGPLLAVSTVPLALVGIAADVIRLRNGTLCESPLTVLSRSDNV